MKNRRSTWNVVKHEMDSFTHFLQNVEKMGHRLDVDQIDLFRRYGDEIIRLNDAVGLISKNDIERIPIRHFLDSLMPAFLNLLPPTGRILDIGSGGGFPGIPLAIFLRRATFCLVESNQRKNVFLRHVRRLLLLRNVTVNRVRVEVLERRRKGNEYDTVVARAIGTIDELVNWSSCLLKPVGKLICYKGPQPEDEIEMARISMEKQRLVLENVFKYESTDDSWLTLVVLRKE